jgi:TfoX/Sxy family transcriptional regulator of competence genes
MTMVYRDSLQVVLAPTIAALPAGVTVEIRHFFSGAAAYANDRICISLTGVGLAMKLPEDGRARLLADGAEPLRYFPKAPIKKQYVVLPDGLAEDPEQLRFWARQSIDHVLTLPAPKRKKPKG